MIDFYIQFQAPYKICSKYGGKVVNHILFMEGIL